MGADRTHVFVLNYNGRALLEECLPSVVAAASRSRRPCEVGVVDNGSSDDSLVFLATRWPELKVWSEPNRGLASFNHVLARSSEPVALLLNNDVKLDPGAIDPLVEAIDAHPTALFSAPQCWTFDGRDYEGMRTRVRMRRGLVQGMCRVPGHERHVAEPDLTASAGPVLAVHRERFLALGGYDPVYFPGRIEDLDLGFRGWMAGWTGHYVPESLAYHRGFGSFGPAFGETGCDRLAVRNSLIFAWKNLHGRALWEHLGWLPARVVHALILRRTAFMSAMFEAARKLGPILEARRAMAVGEGTWQLRQEAFFGDSSGD